MPEYVFSPEVREAAERTFLKYLNEWSDWIDGGNPTLPCKDWVKAMQSFPAYEIRDILSRMHDAKESS
jgi:hypothetical protein